MFLIKNKLEKIGLFASPMLLPWEGADMEKWAVIACDQYTSDPDYWEEVEKTVGSAPSTLKLFLPEVYLETSREKKMNSSIIREMKSYLRSGTLREIEPGFIYTRRTTAYGNVRNGLMACVDLERYSYEKGTTSMIRPTEKTIVERIPPRVKIREKAPLELPHILFLIDDPGKTVIEPLAKTRNLFTKLYDFDLMMNGGSIEGYHITEEKAISNIANAISALADPKVFAEKYNTDKPLLLYAVGDGNHSLASAKQHWENVKAGLSAAEREEHPARFALVEIVNIHDEGMNFEPIHRVLFESDMDDIISEMGKVLEIETREYTDAMELADFVKSEYENKDSHTFGFVSGEKMKSVSVMNSDYNLAVATLQTFLDTYISSHPVEIDFIHDVESTLELAKDCNTAILLPPIDKSGFFRTIIEEGTLPRKAFSMGHADEKRFYLEARKIIK